MPTPADPLILEPYSLYILLFGRGEAYRFHWGLFLTAAHPTSSTAEGQENNPGEEASTTTTTTTTTTPTNPTGTLFELTNPNPSNEKLWTYRTTLLTSFTNRHNPLCALKISNVEPLLQADFHALLATIPVIPYSQRFGEETSCRVWLKEALYELDQSGFIQLVRPVEEIEMEVQQMGMMCWYSRAEWAEGRASLVVERVARKAPRS
ncbi:conserved hypothetical protein [Histoplasma capsulatum G186AR]|uniref:Uncharacterized protein n=1 Tax=Ajellomyces capsulatus (strain G186AR / H82 / ATCC MYA-2454 / RMSCC 2432) TaxID=447093 RepID=C0NP09_AJECG|nr:uncharacterized protein HCBG_04889 [Histoplasma capsulatum G186AR]EEH06669.1 conserved hypothetical protein [Histoplasma capsulatum G186AR]